MGVKVGQIGSSHVLAILYINQNQWTLYVIEILEAKKNKKDFNGFLVQEEVEPWENNQKAVGMIKRIMYYDVHKQ